MIIFWFKYLKYLNLIIFIYNKWYYQEKNVRKTKLEIEVQKDVGSLGGSLRGSLRGSLGGGNLGGGNLGGSLGRVSLGIVSMVGVSLDVVLERVKYPMIQTSKEV